VRDHHPSDGECRCDALRGAASRLGPGICRAEHREQRSAKMRNPFEKRAAQSEHASVGRRLLIASRQFHDVETVTNG